MESALIISDAPKAAEFYRDFLERNGFESFTYAQNGEEARRILIEREFDVCIINTPLLGSLAENLAIDIAEKNVCQVILFVKTDSYESISEQVEDFGVITVEKPISKKLFWSALKLTKVTSKRLLQAQNEIKKLKKKLQEQKEISRAKCLLIERESMTEEQAHHYIEKHAMDQRTGRADIARRVVDFYA